jgi:hypothetical protein
MCICMYVHVCICTCLFKCLCIISVYVHICVYVYVHVHIYLCVHVHAYIYIYISLCRTYLKVWIKEYYALLWLYLRMCVTPANATMTVFQISLLCIVCLGTILYSLECRSPFYRLSLFETSEIMCVMHAKIIRNIRD